MTWRTDDRLRCDGCGTLAPLTEGDDTEGWCHVRPMGAKARTIEESARRWCEDRHLCPGCAGGRGRVAALRDADRRDRDLLDRAAGILADVLDRRHLLELLVPDVREVLAGIEAERRLSATENPDEQQAPG